MPQVTMPDGAVVEMPDKLDANTAARLQAFRSAPPPAKPSSLTSPGRVVAGAADNILPFLSSLYAQPAGVASEYLTRAGNLAGLPGDPATARATTVDALQIQPSSQEGRDVQAAVGAPISAGLERIQRGLRSADKALRIGDDDGGVLQELGSVLGKGAGDAMTIAPVLGALAKPSVVMPKSAPRAPREPGKDLTPKEQHAAAVQNLLDHDIPVAPMQRSNSPLAQSGRQIERAAETVLWKDGLADKQSQAYVSALLKKADIDAKNATPDAMAELYQKVEDTYHELQNDVPTVLDKDLRAELADLDARAKTLLGDDNPITRQVNRLHERAELTPEAKLAAEKAAVEHKAASTAAARRAEDAADRQADRSLTAKYEQDLKKYESEKAAFDAAETDKRLAERAKGQAKEDVAQAKFDYEKDLEAHGLRVKEIDAEYAAELKKVEQARMLGLTGAVDPPKPTYPPKPKPPVAPKTFPERSDTPVRSFNKKPPEPPEGAVAKRARERKQAELDAADKARLDAETAALPKPDEPDRLISGKAAQLARTDALSLSRKAETAELGHDLRVILDKAFDRAGTTEQVAKMNKVRRQYALMRQIQDAVKSSPNGRFSPKRFMQVLGQKNNQSQSVFHRVGEDVAQFAQDAAMVLPENIGNSGTAQRGVDVAKWGGWLAGGAINLPTALASGGTLLGNRAYQNVRSTAGTAGKRSAEEAARAARAAFLKKGGDVASNPVPFIVETQEERRRRELAKTLVR